MEEFISQDVTVIIPLRSGSKGIKNKNIKDFIGLPLYYWSIKKLYHLYKLGKLNKIIISSDSDWYLEKVKLNFGALFGDALILSHRPDYFSTSFTTTEETCLYELKKYCIYDGILGILEVTSPLIPINSLDLMFSSIDEYVDSSFIVYEDIAQFWKCSKPEYKWEALYSDRKMRQQEDKPLFREVGAWAIKIERFLKDEIRIVQPCRPVIVEKEYGLSINNEDDFYYAEYLMKQNSPQIFKDTGIY